MWLSEELALVWQHLRVFRPAWEASYLLPKGCVCTIAFSYMSVLCGHKANRGSVRFMYEE